MRLHVFIEYQRAGSGDYDLEASFEPVSVTPEQEDAVCALVPDAVPGRMSRQLGGIWGRQAASHHGVRHTAWLGQAALASLVFRPHLPKPLRLAAAALLATDPGDTARVVWWFARSA